MFFTDKKQKKRPDVGEIKFLKNCLFESTLRIRMTHQHSFDTDCITLIRFVLSEQKKHPNAQGFLTQLLTSIQSAVKVCIDRTQGKFAQLLWGTIFHLIIQKFEKILRMQELYKRFVKTWIRFANPWFCTVSWPRILTPKRFDLYPRIQILDSYRIVDHESWL